ncbi:hypothetical protein Bbelb_395380 [Branchiostoma belcheri]|nr:hypothetical protein Bbelb_395380 [Branchiostoma belcheri]
MCRHALTRSSRSSSLPHSSPVVKSGTNVTEKHVEQQQVFQRLSRIFSLLEIPSQKTFQYPPGVFPSSGSKPDCPTAPSWFSTKDRAHLCCRSHNHGKSAPAVLNVTTITSCWKRRHDYQTYIRPPTPAHRWAVMTFGDIFNQNDQPGEAIMNQGWNEDTLSCRPCSELPWRSVIKSRTAAEPPSSRHTRHQPAPRTGQAGLSRSAAYRCRHYSRGILTRHAGFPEITNPARCRRHQKCFYIARRHSLIAASDATGTSLVFAQSANNAVPSNPLGVLQVGNLKGDETSIKIRTNEMSVIVSVRTLGGYLRPRTTPSVSQLISPEFIPG